MAQLLCCHSVVRQTLRKIYEYRYLNLMATIITTYHSNTYSATSNKQRLLTPIHVQFTTLHCKPVCLHFLDHLFSEIPTVGENTLIRWSRASLTGQQLVQFRTERNIVMKWNQRSNTATSLLIRVFTGARHMRGDQ